MYVFVFGIRLARCFGELMLKSLVLGELMLKSLVLFFKNGFRELGRRKF